MPDPLSQVYNAIWDEFESHTELTSVVRVGNRIKFDSQVDPSKTNVQYADAPEVVIAPESIVRGNRSSSSYGLIVTYVVVSASMDFQYTDNLSLIEWYLINLLIHWKNTSLGSLTWQSKPYLDKVELLSSQEGLADLDPVQERRRKKGFTAIMRFEVHMNFDRTDLGF